MAASPNARRTAAEGLHDGCLRLRLAAPPVDCKANEVLMAWLADELHLGRRSVTLLRGETSRRKTVVLDTPPGRVAEWLQALIGSPPGSA